MRSQRGLSLVVVMIGLSIVSVILLAVFRLLDMSRDMAASLQDVIKSMDATQEVRFAMADVATCTFNFRGLQAGSHTQPTVVPRVLEFALTAGGNPPDPGNGGGGGGGGRATGREGFAGGGGGSGNGSGGGGAGNGSGTATGSAGSGGGTAPGGGGVVPPLTDTDLPVITFGGLGETTVRVDRVTINMRNPPVPNAAEINIEMVHLGRRAGQKLRTRSVPVWIRTDPQGRISCCNTRSLALCP